MKIKKNNDIEKNTTVYLMLREFFSFYEFFFCLKTI